MVSDTQVKIGVHLNLATCVKVHEINPNWIDRTVTGDSIMTNVHMLESPEYRGSWCDVMSTCLIDVLLTCKSNRDMMTNVHTTHLTNTRHVVSTRVEQSSQNTS